MTASPTQPSRTHGASRFCKVAETVYAWRACWGVKKTSARSGFAAAGPATREQTSSRACVVCGCVEIAAARGMKEPSQKSSQRSFVDGKSALGAEILLVEAQQVRHVGGDLGSERFDLGVLQAQGGLAQQVEAETVHIARLGDQEAEHTVDPLVGHTFRAE